MLLLEKRDEMAKSSRRKRLESGFLGGDKQETIQLYEEILSDANEYGL
jgi:hypothetical protein